MKLLMILPVFLIACASAKKQEVRLIDHRSYWLGCVDATVKYARPQSQAAADRISKECAKSEAKTRIGVGE